ncbi:MAG: hypothetical protein R3F11_31430 [Verrucomicrobiales bacterium]
MPMLRLQSSTDFIIGGSLTNITLRWESQFAAAVAIADDDGDAANDIGAVASAG